MKELRTVRQPEKSGGTVNAGSAWWLNYLMQPALFDACDDNERATLRILQRVQPVSDYRYAADLYRRATDMLLKQLLREVRQIAERHLRATTVSIKMQKLICCTDGLINIAAMSKPGGGAPGSKLGFAGEAGSFFQRAQMRYIEIYCTRLVNLVDEIDRTALPSHPTTEDYFEGIYWRREAQRNGRAASDELRLFDNTYRADLYSLARRMQGHTIEERMLTGTEYDLALRGQLREFDRNFNVLLPAAMTGAESSVPRRFFPSVWSSLEGDPFTAENTTLQ